MKSNTELRQEWMQVLARAGQDLHAYSELLEQSPFQFIRAPETGMVMVRARMGGTGQAFNAGEMTVTRCVVRLSDGQLGYSYLAGRDKKSALLAALADAHLQGEQSSDWHRQVIQPLQKQQVKRRAQREQAVATSRVNFFTMVRGDD